MKKETGHPLRYSLYQNWCPVMVRVVRLERTVSWSQTRRDTNFAIPGYSISAIIPRREGKSKIFLSVVIPVVKTVFVPLSVIGESPVNAGVARLCGVSPCPVPDTATALPNQARYQLRYTRIFNLCHDTTASGKNKVFSVCGHSCGQSHFYAVFCNRGKSCKRRCHKALRRFALPRPGYRHGTPKPPALPTALIPDIQLLSLYHGEGRKAKLFLAAVIYVHNTYWTVEEKSYEEYGLM